MNGLFNCCSAHQSLHLTVKRSKACDQCSPSDESLRTRNIIDVSEGEKQRTWLAFSLAQQKNIIMWDEPLSKIDDHGKRFFAKLIRSLADEGKTVVTVSHDNESIESTGTKNASPSTISIVNRSVDGSNTNSKSESRSSLKQIFNS